jgi:serine/threonine-protein kinase ULK/ATG1
MIPLSLNQNQQTTMTNSPHDMNSHRNNNDIDIDVENDIDTDIEVHQNSHPQKQTKKIANYTLQKRLGSGSFATVYKAFKVIEDNNDDDSTKPKILTVAIKAISRTTDKITPKVLDNLQLEINILQNYRHPNIVALHQVTQTTQYIYLILEYCAGGDLQQFLRSRKNHGRLSERFTRRLMRDLTAGLKFLWMQQLIHRDIKPQNLLLTGCLPLDEVDDPSKSEEEEEKRKRVDFPSELFHLKIADFGFARHLQTTSMADTLCGSPLYMAPEILQHRRYDSKADLWSAGAVLFEMIAGKPPFHGENHIDLLRNIQQKAVRLPPDVKISPECVKLLRLLLNRNPLARAGFHEFIQASDAFVALGCNGVAASGPTITPGSGTDNANRVSSLQSSSPAISNLGPISEDDEVHDNAVSDNMTTEASHAVQNTMNTDLKRIQDFTSQSKSNIDLQDQQRLPSQGPVTVSYEESKTPTSRINYYPHNQMKTTQIPYKIAATQYTRFTPLEPSPPSNMIRMDGMTPPPLSLENDQRSMYHYSSANPQQSHPYGIQSQRRSDSLYNSDDSGFVMVEHGGGSRGSGPNSPITSKIIEDPKQQDPSDGGNNSSNTNSFGIFKQSSLRRVVPAAALSRGKSNSPSSSSMRNKTSSLLSCNILKQGLPFVGKGMLSTSPGTGGALVGMMGSTTSPLSKNLGRVTQEAHSSYYEGGNSMTLEFLAKMLSTADDVGRRAVNVAHVGDTRAFLAMKAMVSHENSSSILYTNNTSPMEGLVEEDIQTNNDNNNINQDVDDEEMPFAMTAPILKENEMTSASSLSKPNNISATVSVTSSAASTRADGKVLTHAILEHFREALSCYIKSLSMLKGSVNASQHVLKTLMESFNSNTNPDGPMMEFKKRCEVSYTWLTGQFKGVLERADAANVQISKWQQQINAGVSSATSLSSADQEKYKPISIIDVNELIYNHSLACGRDGAVKQLLGQYELARSCYRSAGLLAETLLMEPKLFEEDRKVLEDYVSSFAERINEVDVIMFQQSTRGSSVVSCGVGSGMRNERNNVPH